MWDFSWITRRWGEEAEYADWDRVLDELVDRGYRCVRIDASPHLVAPGLDGEVLDTAVVLPQRAEFLWGNHTNVEIRPAADLVEFMGKLAARGLTAGLSTWMLPDTTGRADTILRPDDYVRVWAHTLELLEREGLHDTIEWVDLQNEFPLGLYTPGYELIFGVPRGDNSPLQRKWTDAERATAQTYLDAIGPLRDRWPELRYTVSYTSILHVFDLDASGFDLCEPHIWVGPLPPFAEQTAHNPAMRCESPEAVQHHVEQVDAVYWNESDTIKATLAGWMDIWHGWAEARGLPLVTTEGWASVHYDTFPVPSGRDPWDYMRDVADAAVDHALVRGWEGVCTSNFSQPHFPDFWADVDWHRAANSRIDAAVGGQR